MRVKLKKKLNKNSILTMMQCYENSSFYNEYSSIYDEIIQDKVLGDITGFYIVENDNLANTVYSEIIYCIVTLSGKFDEKVNRYFSENDYIRGMLLSTIGDYLLFETSTELHSYIKEEYSERDINLGARYDPGSHGIEMSMQGVILDKIREKHDVSIDITSGFMYNPQKTLGFYYKASTDVEDTYEGHDCSICEAKDCIYRKPVLVVNDRKIKVEKGTNLLDALRDNNINIKAHCGGSGKCGKCKVKQVGGKKLVLKQEERQYLTQDEIELGVVLSCYHNIIDDIEIELLKDNNSGSILGDIKEVEISEGRYKAHTLGINDLDIDGKSMVCAVNDFLGHDYEWGLKNIRLLSEVVDTEKIYVITSERKVVYIGAEASVYGIALDIGTTTIVLSLVDLLSGNVIDVHKVINPQLSYGADIISRIDYASKDSEGRLGSIMRQAIEEGLELLLMNNDISSDHLVEMAVGANTTMKYLLLDINPNKLGFSPFTCIDTDARSFSWNDVFKNHLYDIDIYIMPSISAYIGGDIVSGLLYSDIDRTEDTILLIDIGTNGEMALKIDNEIICVSTAAGPALEGANIECGTTSVEGAINHINITSDGINYSTIGDSVPSGITGTALIDIIAEFVRIERIDDTGRLDTDIVTIYKDKDADIFLSQRDIRQYQLAKAAIRAGIDTLLNKAGIGYKDIDKLCLAGGIANHLDIDNAIAAGLIPAELGDKVSLIGNSSLGGCLYQLVNMGCDDRIADILGMCRYIELSMDEGFNNSYIENMTFEKG